MNEQVDILLGLDCNQKCVFCFQEDASITSKNTLVDIGNILKALIEGRKKGIRRVNIAGGEATIYKEFKTVISLSKKMGYESIKLVTNGLRFADEEFTKENIAHITDMAFSIHGPNSEIHDALTGVPRSFDKALKGLANVKLYGPDIDLINHIVLTPENISHIKEHIEFVIRSGFDKINFLNIMPNTTINKRYFISPETISENLMKIIDEYKNRIKIDICHIQPCYFPGYEEYISGYDYNKKFISNRENILDSWQKTVNDFKILRDKCVDCSFKEDCKGFWDLEKRAGD